MNFNEMNNLVREIRQMNQHLNEIETQPMLAKKLRNQVMRFKTDYEQYITAKLMSTYKNHFPFDRPDHIEKYLTEEGAYVEKDQEGNPGLKITIQSHPVRIVLKDCRSNMEKVAWQIMC